ncbi:hypothetical protein VTK73DRAFT_8592 [Phialemonium thermophilum]|uniref:Uncharacterized protein n=1 Tax=Phialemonium thermophilum TaxID=223376 RepID=A0ABR3W7J7_9PEZI
MTKEGRHQIENTPLGQSEAWTHDLGMPACALRGMSATRYPAAPIGLSAVHDSMSRDSARSCEAPSPMLLSLSAIPDSGLLDTARQTPLPLPFQRSRHFPCPSRAVAVSLYVQSLKCRLFTDSGSHILDHLTRRSSPTSRAHRDTAKLTMSGTFAATTSRQEQQKRCRAVAPGVHCAVNRSVWCTRYR